ncbi:MAG TPA: hypothetical protein VH330_01260 [Candidatus Udaeobacter sp.]|jgi:hypothetical protein
MTPQGNFMILAPIVASREAELRGLLDSMNEAPGSVNPNNPLVPFAQFDTLHFARFVILDDKTVEDLRIYGLPVRNYPLYLAFLGDMDGDEEAFLNELVRRASNGLRAIFSCCHGFASDTDLMAWMKLVRSPASAAYVNTRGRTVRRIREEAALRDAIESRLARQTSSFEGLAPREIHAQLKQFVEAEKSAGRLTLSDEEATPLGWWTRKMLHLIGMPLLLLLASPLLILIAPFYLFQLRRLEKTDPEPYVVVDDDHFDALAEAEDHDVTNPYSALGSLKPGLLRLMTLWGVLLVIDYATRHIIKPGRLGRVRTIHFARWVLIGGNERLGFFSNYDGGNESYMDDFINKLGFGLNLFTSNGIGYPRTDWLLQGGSADERRFKEFQRRHTVLTQVWYKAYPGLTAVDLERNTRIRRGLESSSMNEQEAREWLALI